MWLNFDLIRADFLQRTRSYSFLITIAICCYLTYLFIPEPNATYTTLGLGQFKGFHNAAWVGNLTAIMSSFFLGWAGFFLVSSGIQKDIKTGLGQIIATTSISNYSYLQSKAISNFLVLLVALIVVLFSAITLFLFRSNYPLELQHFLFPFMFISIPSMFIIAHAAVIAEIIFKNKTILQNVLCYYIFAALIPLTMISNEIIIYANPLGVNYITEAMKLDIFNQFNMIVDKASMGFVFSSKTYTFFELNPFEWSPLFLLSRLAWIIFSIVSLIIFSLFFHRFDIKKKISKVSNKKYEFSGSEEKALQIKPLKDIVFNFSIWPLIRSELTMLLRDSNRFIQFATLGIWIGFIAVPIETSIKFLLPILLFIHIQKWSKLGLFDRINRTETFVLSSYNPIKRVYSSRLIASLLFTLLLSFPLIVKAIYLLDIWVVLTIIMGSLFLVNFAYLLTLITRSRKLFEILFTMMTLAILQEADILNYVYVKPEFFGSIALVSMFIIFIVHKSKLSTH